MKCRQEVGSGWIPSLQCLSLQMLPSLIGLCVVGFEVVGFPVVGILVDDMPVVGMPVVGMPVVGIGVVVVIEAGAVAAPGGSLQLWLIGQSQFFVTALKVRPVAHWTLKA